MSETSHSGELSTLKQKAAEVVSRHKDKIKNPIARFNLNLNGKNEEISFKDVPGELQIPPLTERLKEELKTPMKLVDPETGQKINALQLNWHQFNPDSGRATIFLPSINNPIRKPEGGDEQSATDYRLQELARYLSVEPLIAFDYLGVGLSDPVSKAQLQAFKTGKGFEEIIKSQLRVLQSVGVKEIDIVAQSLGAYGGVLMAYYAKLYGIRVRNAVLTEAPGVSDTTMPDMFLNRFVSESVYRDLYQATPLDPEMMKAGFNLQSKTHAIYADFKWLMKGIFKGKGLKYGKEISLPTLSLILEAAMRKNPEMAVAMINGSMSKIAPNNDVNAAYEDLRSRGLGDRVRRIIFPGEPHVVMENAKRYAWMTKFALRGKT